MTLLSAFPEDRRAAGRLGAALGRAVRLIEMHRFPDGETLPTVPTGSERVVLYRSLDRPDPKVMPLLLVADAWRRCGVNHLTLVAPYIAYLRQDAVFRVGEPLSRDVQGRLLGGAFDRIVTVDPHLHRTSSLGAVIKTEITVLSAAPVLAQAIGTGEADWVVVGPDVESRPWAAAVAQALGAPHVVLTKDRFGDREVSLSGDLGLIAGRAVVLVDDICSSGATLEAALGMLQQAGARLVDIAVTHALFDRTAEQRLRSAGARRLLFTDSCADRRDSTPLASILADALKDAFSS